MADIEDVCAVLATAITDFAYPHGTSRPSAIGVPVQVQQGWPLEQALDQIAAKPGVTAADPITLVSIYPVPGTTSDGGTPMDFSPAVIARTRAGISVEVAEDVVTFAGIAVGGEIATIIVNGSKAYSYVCQPGETEDMVAALLSFQIEVDFPDTTWVPQTAILTIPGAYKITARVGTSGTIGRKIHRQKTQIRIVVWSSNPTDRKTVASRIDALVKAIVTFAMPDTSQAIVTYAGTNLSDNSERQGLYRRDLICIALFDTIEEIAATEITVAGVQASLPGRSTSSSS